MPYVTVAMRPYYHQISLEDILANKVGDNPHYFVSNITNTRTKFMKSISQDVLQAFDFRGMLNAIIEFNNTHSKLIEADKSQLYDTFHIPKKSGGLREINAPVEILDKALRELKTIFESQFQTLYHTTAFAYVKGRSTIDALKRHQRNDSKWFVKLDFSNFFGSTTESFVFSMLSKLFPFNEVLMRFPEAENELKKALSVCFLNGGLPQGTPISPLLTNVMMIPIDHHIANGLKKKDTRFIYTRYADDMIISSKVKFDPDEVQNFITDILSKFEAPFELNKKKTRFGSSSGRNWNLGLMLNKDNEITIGYRKKKIFKAMCHSYITDKKNNKSWDYHSLQKFQGLISYYRMVEKGYINYVINHFNKVFQVDMEKMIKIDLNTL